jgi:hypothetical protein
MSKLWDPRSPNLIASLSNLRTKALRKGIWFQALTYQERTLAGLIRKHVKIVKNATLAAVIAKIMGKLISAIKSSFMDRIEGLGRPVAEAWSRGALAMGWKEASTWTDDPNIVRWYGLTVYYSGFRMGTNGGIAG